ncbi:hypothetical protein F444_21538, partial [Phytophthora nicotianae P1976]
PLNCRTDTRWLEESIRPWCIHTKRPESSGNRRPIPEEEDALTAAVYAGNALRRPGPERRSLPRYGDRARGGGRAFRYRIWTPLNHDGRLDNGYPAVRRGRKKTMLGTEHSW